jgi:hypothetical protein
MKRAILAGLAATAIAAAALSAAVTGGPAPSAAADHVDAPGLTPPGGNLQLDVTDIYAWRARNGKTVLAANVNGLTASGQNPVFASAAPSVAKTERVTYWFRVDNDGDAVPDVNLAVRFGKADDKGVQEMTVRRNGRVILTGTTSPGNGVKINRDGGVLGYAGLRDDPFFFDLDGFLNILSTEPGKSFISCTSPRTDFFAGKNVSAIVLELPTSLLTRPGSSQIGVWATTTVGSQQIDRMGRPAINTVFIPNNPLPPDRTSDGKASKKNTFNASAPRNDQANFRSEVVDTLTVLYSLNDGAGDDKSDDSCPTSSRSTQPSRTGSSTDAASPTT